MTSLFISHSSADRELAHEIAARLTTAGYGALFLDSDREQGIAAGARWERELYAALRRSDGVIFVGTEAAASSRWCFAEIVVARSVGTPIFAIGTHAGPSMDLDGPVYIYRWKNALSSKADSLTTKDELIKAVTVPFGEKADHAEGLSIVTRSPLTVLVSYDSPLRLDGSDKSGVVADIFEVTR